MKKKCTQRYCDGQNNTTLGPVYVDSKRYQTALHMFGQSKVYIDKHEKKQPERLSLTEQYHLKPRSCGL